MTIAGDDRHTDAPPPLAHWLAHALQRCPAAPAIVAQATQLSYAELAARVHAAAAQLHAAGLRGPDRVAIAATRSVETVVWILAAVHAGVAYVPLDLSYPAERLRHMLDDASPRAIIGDEAALQQLSQALGALPSLAAPAPRTPPPFAACDDLCYVLFTSGSTGRPKGVAMGALPLRHLIAWHAQHPRLGQAATTLQFAPLSFDVHFQEIFSTLSCGGCLVLVTDAQRRDPRQLAQALRLHRVERLFLPYVALQMLADASANEAMLALRDVVSAGEQLQVTTAIRALFQRLPDAVLHNHYGPTETHVVTAYELAGDASTWPSIPPIGLPLPHVRVALAPLEDAGANEGELLLGGDTLAAGYLGRESLTHERFLPAHACLAGRVYRSGDRVRREVDGVLTYLGRSDTQLKIDGYRVEPGDIEVVLLSHADVQEAAVGAVDVPGMGRQLVAWYVAKSGAAAGVGNALRQHLRERLPDYLQPARFIALPQLPLTPSGKLDRRSLALPEGDNPDAALHGLTPAERVAAIWRDALGQPDLDADSNLFAAGARSLLVLRVIERFKQAGIRAIGIADIYDRPSIAQQITLLQSGAGAARSVRTRDTSDDAIAIVGMAVRTAGAESVEAFWQNLLDDREGIRHFRDDELDASVPAEWRRRPNFVAARGVIDAADRFDAAFFDISAREAVLIDPQQRLLLELAWNALEHAAIAADAPDLRIGVYAGTANNTYAPALRAAQPELIAQSGEFAAMLASEKDYVATRIAHRLNLHGPAMSVHTACSTGLVAVAQAAQALAAGLCDLALAGGASVIVPQAGGYLHVEGSMESADGRCRPFDADASGTVFASGAGLVVLKRLSQAQRDGDTVYALIRGIGLNNDGGGKASFTAPSVSGQAAAIRSALDHAGVSARDIGFVEAHGTATALGDPIEVAALQRAYRADTPDCGYCVLGSLKSQLGHTIAAAGVLGLIKATLALHHERIPATRHFRQPNPQIDFGASPFFVSGQMQAWPRGERARYAAVSSFGVGGTNAHLVLQEAPLTATAAATDSAAPMIHVLALSARSDTALQQRAHDLAQWLQQHPQADLAQVSATLLHGRAALPQRAVIAASSIEAAITALGAVRATAAPRQTPRLVYLFPGQGSQHPGMAAALHANVGAFRFALDEALAACAVHLDIDLGDLLIAARADDAQAAEVLNQTRYAQPALFCMSWALSQWLRSLDLRPDALIGHSIGEYAAACEAGIVSLTDAARAVCARGAAMYAQPPGAMLAVRTAASKLLEHLPAGAEIAAINAPELCVVAGPADVITALAEQLERSAIVSRRLQVSHAFHSAMMQPALAEVAAALQGVTLQAPTLPLYSCVSGAPMRADEATDPAYWARQVRAPVQFNAAVSAEIARGDAVFIEVGPAQALTALLRQQRNSQGSAPLCLPLLPAPTQSANAAEHAVAAVAQLWCHGLAPRWPMPRTAARAALPTYPFADTRYWFQQPVAATAGPLLSQVVAVTTAEEIRVSDRRPVIEQELLTLLSDVSGIARSELERDAEFIAQGLDSLSLTQATLEIERVFGIKLRFRRLMEDLATVELLVAFLHEQLPADRFAPAAPVATPVASIAASDPMVTAHPFATVLPAMAVHTAGNPALLSIVQQQMNLMAQQLALLSGHSAPVSTALPAALPPATPTIANAPAESADSPNLRDKPFGASARITVKPVTQMTPAQQAWVSDFTQRYLARSGKSRTFSQQHRARMADPRVVTGFNPLWKDLVYPIVAERSDGARVWDIDGNAYIDLLSCFGANLLGYQPPAVIAAMHAQLDAGIEVGPQHPLAAEVADLISEFTGHARVGFCNTGSEAVMGAMRIARTVTGRKTIAIFTNSYHGIFDEVIVRGTRQLRSLSAAPGILANAVENVLVLDYASDDALRILRERGNELAAIMIEPIQNKYPTLQPREFVQQLRQIADESGCALIFDEVVTGFRLGPAGAQQHYGVRADICTYGKIIGGGLPFAAIAGAAHWLDALDGGHWQYGDDSYPEAGVTYFAGTFVRHPLALAAARASLLHLKQAGQAFYDDLNARTQHLVDRLNAAFLARQAPVKAVHCASLWRLQWDDEQKYVSLFYYLARFHGLHLYEQFGHFVTAAMGADELGRIADIFMAALDELMALGFITRRDGLPPPSPGKPTLDSSSGPLTPGQTERWLAASFDTAALRALNETLCLSLRGDIDLAALQQALRDVLARHAAFRLRLHADEPAQSIDTNYQPVLRQVDLRGQADAQLALLAWCDQAGQQEFTLDRAALVQLSLLQLSDGRCVVHLVASHLVFDGWAASVLLRELALCYRARCLGQSPNLPPAESPIAFAIAEQERLRSADAAAALQYWRQQLRNPPAPLSLGDRTPDQPRRFSADTLKQRFSQAQLQQWQHSACLHKATLFQWLLSAVAVVLRRCSAQDDFVVCIPYASQSLGRHEHLLADGVLDLPLRLHCAADADLQGLLPDVRARLMDALEHPLITQGLAARELELPSLGDRPPLGGVYFNLNPRIDLSGYAPLQAETYEMRKPGLLGELIFNFYEERDGLSLDLHYSTEYFSAARIEQLAAQLQQALGVDALTAAATATPALVDGGTSTDTTDVIAAANATERPAPPYARIEQWVSATASQQGERIAVVAAGQTLSYAQLDARATAIAHGLRARGVAPGDLVGLCLTRSTDLLAALLAVLKCGAAYVPMDPAFPAQRLRDMAEDAGIRLLLTQSEHLSLFDPLPATAMVLDHVTDELARASREPLSPSLSADAPAYVIYTSGSTGKPKGVVVTQRNVCNFLHSMAREPGLDAHDCVLAVTTLSFDIAVLELLLPLVVGARVVLAQRADVVDGDSLVALIAQHGVSVMQATPTTWHLLLDAGFTAPAGFRALCGGEALPPALAARLLRSGAQLWNMYGPTETTVWSTLCRIESAQTPISVGRPIDNTVVRILDANDRLCSVGESGEICIGGAGVAQGYHARPELTAERFIADRWSREPNARLYRTGDLGCWTAQGQIAHQGRLDHQIKLRGYRIELGEIEAQLQSCAGVARAVVATQTIDADVRLIAYVVATAGATPELASLRNALEQQLPDYMLPQHLVLLATLPLLPNGKINRQALPAIDANVAAPALPPAAATSTDAPLELRIATLMAEVLRLPQVLPEQNFFRLGGHSLLAAQLATRLGQMLGNRPNLRTVFEAPTPRALAARLHTVAPSATATPVIPRRESDTIAPLSLMQQRLWFLEQLHPGTTVNHIPSAHRLRGPLQQQAFEHAFAMLIARQDVLRSVIETDVHGERQRVLPSLPASLPLLDFSDSDARTADERLQAYIAGLMQQPFDLHHGPLFRAALVRLRADEHVFVFIAHHLIWDGWSFDLLYRDMAALYDAFRQNQPDPLPALSVRYGDFADWHARWMSGPELARQTAHWRERLTPLPEPLQLPLDKPRPAVFSGNGSSHHEYVSRELLDALHAGARRRGSTVFVTLLGAYALMLHRLSQQDDLIIGTPVRGREQPELDGVMGFFVNALPLRSRRGEARTLEAWLAQIQSTVVDAFAYPDVPMEHLVRELKPARDASRPPIHQALFSFQDVRGRPTQWGDLNHSRVEIPLHGAAHELSLWCVETPNTLECVFTYNSDLFDADTAQRFGQRYAELLHQMATAPDDVSLDALALMPPAERAQVQALSHPTAVPYPSEQPLAALLATHAHATTPALRCGDEVLTHAQLDAAANQLAHALRQRGIGRGALVGLCLSRTPQMLIALLATLKAGAAYVPLDPSYPAERLRYMAGHAALSLLLTESPLLSLLEWPAAATLCLDQLDGSALPGIALAADAERDARATDPAYVIYTSGSTGTPKGVVVPQQAVVNFLHSMAKQPGLNAGETLLAVTTLSFDIAVLELLLPLYCGAQVVLATREQAIDGNALRTLLERHGARVMQATPTTWRLLIEAGWRGHPGFRALVGGEALPPDLALALHERTGELWNMYGPTETTVWSSVFRVIDPAAPIRIGQPIDNTDIYILDDKLRPCPLGVSGEIYIGGAGLSLGYLHQPELSRERFVVPAWTPAPATALYRTGDRGRWNGDGQLEHLGRIDFQVKLRGFRIELGEIESCLLARADVAACVVTLREDTSPARLVAYVVATPGHNLHHDRLREQLRAQLPAYMLPQQLLTLPALPLLPNGKIDRKALPAPDPHAGVTHAAVPLAGLDPREQLLLRIARDLLGHDGIGPDDNFFDQGGHSLLALRLMAQVEAAVGVRLNLLRIANSSLRVLAAELPMTPADTTGADTPARAGLRQRLGRLFGFQSSAS